MGGGRGRIATPTRKRSSSALLAAKSGRAGKSMSEIGGLFEVSDDGDLASEPCACLPLQVAAAPLISAGARWRLRRTAHRSHAINGARRNAHRQLKPRLYGPLHGPRRRYAKFSGMNRYPMYYC